MDLKEKAGYKFIENANASYENRNILVAVYQKGSQYAKYGIGEIPDDFSGVTPSNEVERKALINIRLANEAKGNLVYMIVGDFSREGSKKLENFTF